MLTVIRMDSIPAGDNPFEHDLFHMGTRLGKNVMIMHENHTSEMCNYLIIVNVDTGERFRVAITPAGEKRSVCEQIMTDMVKGE